MLNDPPTPALVNFWNAGVVVGLEIRLVISTPAISAWNLGLGSKAIFAMISGCTAGAVIALPPLLIWPPSSPPSAVGGVMTPPPPDPPTYGSEFSNEIPRVTLSLG